jgi:tetraacyldisaccharide 4'-kinase
VPLKEPGWWYGANQQGLARVLQPVGALYGAVAEFRLQHARPFKVARPVICVGNFTAGGTGKTPFVRVLVEHLRRREDVPVILSRGYGGQLTGPHWVDVATDTANAVGDEPLLLARDAPVMIARDRAAGARAIVGDATKSATVIVMDDGLQNASLIKDLRIAVVDGVRGFGNGRIIPAGPLRARLDAQFARVDAIVVNHGLAAAETSTVADHLRRDFTGPVLDAKLSVRDADTWFGQRVVAFAGIGVPERFFSTLESVGAQVCERVTFADHHVYTDADAAHLLARMRAQNAVLVTTEKDAARLFGEVGACAELHHIARVLSIDLQLTPRDQTRLDALIAGVLGYRAGLTSPAPRDGA